MTTTQLKKSVIHKISDIEDDDFLKAINKILEARSPKSVYKLSAEQKKGINKAKTQIKNNDFITNEQLEKYESKWLNKN